jgi:hypothetical protein
LARRCRLPSFFKLAATTVAQRPDGGVGCFNARGGQAVLDRGDDPAPPNPGLVHAASAPPDFDLEQPET